jgi:hypothetical protein
MQQFLRIELTENVRYIQGMKGMCTAEPLIITPYAFDGLLTTEQLSGLSLYKYVEEYDGHTLWKGGEIPSDTKRVAFTHEGGMGDELIWSAFLWQLRYDHPAIDFTNYTQGLNGYMALGAVGVNNIPSPFGFREAEIASYDAWIIPSPVTYEQRGTKDDAYSMNADEINMETVRFPRPHVVIPEEEVADIRELLGRLPEQFWSNLVLIQLSANDLERSPDFWPLRLRSIVDTIDELAPNRFWYAIIGTTAECNLVQLRSGLAQHPRTVAAPWGAATSLSPRVSLYLSKIAKAVVTPDSMLLHAAAAFETPCLALWNYGNGGSKATALDSVDPNRVPINMARREARKKNRFLAHVQDFPERQIPPPESRVEHYQTVSVLGMDEHPMITSRWVESVLKETCL